jgi:predicted ATPase
VGGVGKTRLALQVAADLTGEFADGVWLLELAPVGDPAAVPDAVAGVLGVTPQAGVTVTESITQALSGRRLLLVLDNCEHILDAVADLVAQILARTTTVKVVATSREGLRVGAEQLWSVPPLDVTAGAESAAVALFVERAQAVNPALVFDAADSSAVIEICRRLDGIALAIELAAARMVSMSAQDLRDRLGDRFRLLSGSRRGLERHQTLRQAVGWSYDLLGADERAVLERCSVFAGGFHLAAATHVCERFDEYAVLDVLDSLVRKSLVTVDRVEGHTRYGMLETIRQFAEERLAATSTTDDARGRHAAYFAAQTVAYWDMWDGPRQRVALDWVDVEFANLRAGFRWAADHHEIDIAAAIAAHTTMLAFALQRLEPIGWAEELLRHAGVADARHLPRLCTAASLCNFTGRAEAAVAYAWREVELKPDPRYEPFDAGWAGLREAIAYYYAGQLDRYVEICTVLTARGGLSRVAGLSGLPYGLAALGRGDEARAIAEEAVSAARAHGNPYLIAYALAGYGRVFAETEPDGALRSLREALVYTQQHRLPVFEALIAEAAAALEAVHGDPGHALELFETAITSFHRAGNVPWIATTLADLALLFDRVERPGVAATIYGASSHRAVTSFVLELPDAVEHLRRVLGAQAFEDCVAAGATMELADAVAYARHQIELARWQLEARP